MMQMRNFGLAGLCLAIAGCGMLGPSLNAQAEQMELALLDCKAQLGIPGDTRTEVRFDGGVAQARVVAFDQTSAQKAAQINACANSAQVLDDGLVVMPLQSNALPAVAVDVVSDGGPSSYRGGQCSGGQTGMVGGTSYCVGRYS
ncbi:MAG: hypothetical protein ABF248_10975 [Yoonia sp.]